VYCAAVDTAVNGHLDHFANGRVVARITLSRRNLQTLLDKLASEGDGTIWKDIGAGVIAVVSAEEDDSHYAAGNGPRRADV
jgi:hypothetical protein